MKKTVRVFFVVVNLLFLFVLPARGWAHELFSTAHQSHGFISPGRSESFLVRHDFGIETLTTLLHHRGSTTILYVVEFIGPYGAVIRAYNFGPFPQRGSFTIGYWQ